MNDVIAMLEKMRAGTGEAVTVGLPEETIRKFAQTDPALREVIAEAAERLESLQADWGDLLKLPEEELAQKVQEDFVNFYPGASINPYVAIAAKGSWIVTAFGAVLHDSGGYGMLGQGHSPQTVIKAMGQNQVMANIMTPNFSQLRFAKLLKNEVGHARGKCPYDAFVCMNSGSESVTVAARISDNNAALQTAKGARHEGKKIKFLSLEGSFHGRTDRPAQFSDSCMEKYKSLATFRDRDNLITVTPNDVDSLRAAFAQAKKDNVYIEAMFMEPVMGEGDPGKAATPEFYAEARKLTEENDTLFVVDSIQAGLRAQGCLSITDYPGFEKLPAPDMETYSKALNAGQYPLSVLALSEKAKNLYKVGIYGNTMTTNPRALDVACAVLEAVTPELRKNIRERGLEVVEKLSNLKDELGGMITKVQGTGLLFSAELDGSRFKVVAHDGIEVYMRKNGIGVIHGGENSLRFTPPLTLTSKEVDLIVAQVKNALLNGPKLS